MEQTSSNPCDGSSTTPECSSPSKALLSASSDLKYLNESNADSSSVSSGRPSVSSVSSSVSSGNATPKTRRKNKQKVKKEFCCSFCGKIFDHKGNMQQHERSHTNERPFSCSVCGMSYNKSSHLLEHRRRHAGVVSFERHSCTICERSFISKSSLDCHIRSHYDDPTLSCCKCKGTFRHKSTLNRHLKVCHGNKHYTCDICQKRFVDSSDLKKHVAIHNKTQKYECETCKRTFTSTLSLKTHLRGNNICKVSTYQLCERKSHSYAVGISENEEITLSADIANSVNSTKQINIDIVNDSGMKKKELQMSDHDYAFRENKLAATQKPENNHIGHVEMGYSEDVYSVKEEIEDTNNDSRNNNEIVVSAIQHEQAEHDITIKQETLDVFESQQNDAIEDNILMKKEKVETDKVLHNAKTLVGSKDILENTSCENIKPVTKKETKEVEHEENDSLIGTFAITPHFGSFSNDEQQKIGTESIYENVGRNTSNVGKTGFRESQSETVQQNAKIRKTVKIFKLSEFSEKLSKFGIKTKEKESSKDHLTTKFRFIRPKIQINGPEKQGSVCSSQIALKSKRLVPVNAGLTKLSAQRNFDKFGSSRNKYNNKANTKMSISKICFLLRKKYSDKVRVEGGKKPSIWAHGRPNVNKQFYFIKTKQINNMGHMILDCNQLDITENKKELCGTTSLSGQSAKTSLTHTVEEKLTSMKEEKLDDTTCSEKTCSNTWREGICNSHETMKCVEDQKLNDSKYSRNANDISEPLSKNLENEEGKEFKVCDDSPSIEDVSETSIHTIKQENEIELGNNQVVGESNVIKKQQTAIGKPCRHCGKHFETYAEYKKHLRSVFIPKEITCDECKQSFKKWREYSRHKCNERKEIYDFVCAHCDSIFPTENYLKNHMNKKKQQCKVCLGHFCTIEKLNKHMQSHFTYNCTKCPKKFETKRQQTRHLNENLCRALVTVKCNHCERAFKNTKGLNIHVKHRHSNDLEKCENCPKLFVSTDSYKKHIKICKQKSRKVSDDSLREDSHSNENDGQFSFTEEMAKDQVKVYEDMRKSILEDIEETSKKTKEENNKAVVKDMSFSAKNLDTNTIKINTNLAKKDDQIRLFEENETELAVATITHGSTHGSVDDLSQEAKEWLTPEDELPDIENESRSVWTENNSYVKIDNFTLNRNTDTASFENRSDSDEQKFDQDIIDHDEAVDEFEAFTATEKEEDNSEPVDQKGILCQTDKLIISNALFYKRDKLRKNRLKKLRWKTMKQKCFIRGKNNLASRTSFSSTLESSKSNHLKNMQGYMMDTTYVPSNSIKNTTNSAAEDDKDLADKISITHTYELQDQKIKEEKSEDMISDVELEVWDKKILPLPHTFQRKRTSDIVAIDELESKDYVSDFESNDSEDDNKRYEEEEVIISKDLNEGTDDQFELECSNENSRKRTSKAEHCIKPFDSLPIVELKVCSESNIDINQSVEQLPGDYTIEDKNGNVIGCDIDNDLDAVDDTKDSSDSESDEDSDGYEECTFEEVQSMLYSCKKQW